MSVYAIGDVQGCYSALQQLLVKIDFNAHRDNLWFTGDLVNRGTRSLEVLRFVMQLGDRARCVLGNHDLHLLAVASGTTPSRKRDTLETILRAPDRNELLRWLRGRPLLHHDTTLGITMIHAGLLPEWSLGDAQKLAREVEQHLQADDHPEFFCHLYGDQPDRWSDSLKGFDRARVIVNAFTRLRYCDADGVMDLRLSGPPGSQPAPLLPWFRVPGRRSQGHTLVCGHWSALGVHQDNGVVCLDSGCVWGRALTAIRLDASPFQFFSVDCELEAMGDDA